MASRALDDASYVLALGAGDVWSPEGVPMASDFKSYLERFKGGQQQLGFKIKDEVITASVAEVHDDYAVLDALRGNPPTRKQQLRVPFGAITWIE